MAPPRKPQSPKAVQVQDGSSRPLDLRSAEVARAIALWLLEEEERVAHLQSMRRMGG